MGSPLRDLLNITIPLEDRLSPGDYNLVIVASPSIRGRIWSQNSPLLELSRAMDSCRAIVRNQLSTPGLRTEGLRP
ncbi:MAG TPA: hypothetical protein VMU68_12415 [Acidimicrobiales bacterium]|nr:hypothetical protein [Acidimicrobiales bacterium]